VDFAVKISMQPIGYPTSFFSSGGSASEGDFSWNYGHGNSDFGPRDPVHRVRMDRILPREKNSFFVVGLSFQPIITRGTINVFPPAWTKKLCFLKLGPTKQTNARDIRWDFLSEQKESQFFSNVAFHTGGWPFLIIDLALGSIAGGWCSCSS
jgi:hypothetical protein